MNLYKAPDPIGQYIVRSKIGEGGTAQVYSAEHIYLGVRHALKVFVGQLDPRDIAGFMAEARRHAQLNHPRILRVLDMLHDNGRPILATDLMAGSLREAFAKPGRSRQLDSAWTWLNAMREALSFAHSHGIVHRDVKPENILFDSRGEFFLADFGIARTLIPSSQTLQTKSIRGTFEYMAPELFVNQGERHIESDEYALAIMLFEWLTGEVPFTGNFIEILDGHRNLVPNMSGIPGTIQPVHSIAFLPALLRPRILSVRAEWPGNRPLPYRGQCLLYVPHD